MRFYIYLDLNFELQCYAIRVNLHSRDKYQREGRLLSPQDNLRSQIPDRYDRLHYVSSHIADIPADSEDTSILIVQSRSALSQIQYSSFSLGAPCLCCKSVGRFSSSQLVYCRAPSYCCGFLLLHLQFKDICRCAMLCFITV